MTMLNRTLILSVLTFAACAKQGSYHSSRMLALAHSAEMNAHSAENTRETLRSSQRDLSGDVENMLTDVVEAEDKAALSSNKVSSRAAPKKKAKAKKGK